VSKRSGFYPCPVVDTAASNVVSQAGAVLLTETARTVGLDHALSVALAPWRPPNAVHDPGKVLLDLAVTLAVGGDCLADIAVLRAEPGLFGLVASDPTVSRTLDRLVSRRPGRRAARDPHRPHAGPGGGVATGRRPRPRPQDRRKCAAAHRRRRHPGHRPLREGRRGADVLPLTELPESSVVLLGIEWVGRGYVPRP
jgi:hypothetical protein